MWITWWLPGPLMQVVYILGDDEHFAGRVLKSRQHPVRRVGLSAGDEAAAVLIPLLHQPGVPRKGGERCQLCGIQRPPPSALAAKIGILLSAEMPAPVRTRTFLASRSFRMTVASSGAIVRR